MMQSDAYKLYKKGLLYYIINANAVSVTSTERLLSFWLRSQAEGTLAAMNAAFRAGYRFGVYYG